jgi:hypothetical protein
LNPIPQTAENLPDKFCFLWIWHQPSIFHVIAQRRHSAHPHTFALDAAILSRIRSPVTSRSNCAKDSRTFSISLPIEVVVLNCWVTETNDATPLEYFNHFREVRQAAGESINS